MARTAIHVTQLSAPSGIARPAGTALDPTNGHVLTVPRPGRTGQVLLIVRSTTTAKNLTVKAGANPPATGSGAGDMVVPLADGSTTPTDTLVVLSATQFSQADGTVRLDLQAGAAGTIEAVAMPRGA